MSSESNKVKEKKANFHSNLTSFGRPKGVKNKFTKSAKYAFECAFAQCGGIYRLTEWAKENYGEFIKVYARLIPRVVDLTPEAADLIVKIVQYQNTGQNAENVIEAPQQQITLNS